MADGDGERAARRVALDQVGPMIDVTAWGGLFHAYGSATDTPGHLRAMVEVRDLDGVVDHLGGAIVHQGTVWTASPPALTVVVNAVLLAYPLYPTSFLVSVLAILEEAGSVCDLDLPDERPALPAPAEAATARLAAASADEAEELMELLFEDPDVFDPLMVRAAWDVRSLQSAVIRLAYTLEDVDGLAGPSDSCATAWFGPPDPTADGLTDR
jgi:hypothetical protein